MQIPRALILFLAFCGGGAIFGAPLVTAALLLQQPAGRVSSASPSSAAEASAGEPGKILGELTFRAFDLGFDPETIEVDVPGRYAVTFANEGAILHDIRFADGTVIEADAGESASGEVTIPIEGLGYVCSIPGHADAGMQGAITVSGGFAEVPHSGASHEPAAGASIEPDPNSPEYALHDPEAPALARGQVHELTLTVREHEMTVAPGIVQTVWSFGETVPGPVLRVRVGDVVRVTLRNPASNKLPHSVDFHASLVAWNDEMRSINPGGELVYEFTAKYAGVFMYHCGTTPALHHIASGMFGMIIVEPPDGLPPVDHEFALVQSEWYLGEQAGFVSLEEASAAAPAPELVVWNGVANQYTDHPIRVPSSKTIRVFVLNAGPSIDSSFHVVGTVFEEVIKEGVALRRDNDGSWGSQAVDLAPAQGAIVELHFDEDGLYPFVTHAFNFVGRGALGLFQAGDGGEMPAAGH